MKTFAAAVAAAVLLGIAAGGATAAGRACPSSNAPNELVVVAGSGQTAQLGRQFETPLQVQLANTNGCPLTGDLAGISVDFDAPAGGASGTFPSTGSRAAVVGTNAQGVATAPAFVANRTAGAYRVDAHSDYGSVLLDLRNTAAGLAAALAAVGATTAETTVSSLADVQLRVRVVDADGRAVSGATVTYNVLPGATGAGATFAAGPATTTDADGVAASPVLVTNASPGRFTVTASVDGVATPVVFAVASHATSLVVTATQPQAAATVDGDYAPLRAVVRDASGAPVEGAAVTFAVVAARSGAGASFDGAAQATAVTGADGVAVSPALGANATAGRFTVTAAVAGAAAVRYTLTNTAGAPAAIAAGAGARQSTAVRSRFAVRFAVTVTDESGNAVPHAVVEFTAPRRGPTGSFTGGRKTVRVFTNAHGVAVAPRFTASGAQGGYAVVARVHGAAARTAFALVNEARA